MRNLLRFEFFKLKKNPMFYVIGGVLLFYIFQGIFNDFISYINIKNSNVPIDVVLYHQKSADLCASDLLSMPYIALITVIYSTTKALEENHSSNCTIKNTIAKGYTRTQIYFSKYIVSLLTVIAYTIVGFVFSYLVGLIFFGNPTDFRTKYLFLSFIANIIISIALHSINFGVASLVGNTALAILIDTFVIMIIFSMLEGILNVPYAMESSKDYIDVLSYIPVSLAPHVVSAAQNEKIGEVFLTMGISALYSGLGILIGWLGSRNRQY